VTPAGPRPTRPRTGDVETGTSAPTLLRGARTGHREREEPGVKYLVAIYGREHAATTGRVEAVLDEITESGELIGEETLADPAGTRTVRVREGVPAIVEGPFGDAGEQLAGYVLVDCESIDRATEIAARLPRAGSGTVEVRPVMDLSGQDM
jgi:hypothetical protein